MWWTHFSRYQVGSLDFRSVRPVWTIKGGLISKNIFFFVCFCKVRAKNRKPEERMRLSFVVIFFSDTSNKTDYQKQFEKAQILAMVFCPITRTERD